MADLKLMEARIEAKLQELMEARGWDGSDHSWYITYRKDSIPIDARVERIGEYTVTGYQILFYSYRQYNRRFKVDIDESDYDNPTFTIDEKKLDKKIEEVSAILRERDESYRRREKQTEKNEKKAVEFAAEIGTLFSGYKATASTPTSADIEVGDNTIRVEQKGDVYYCTICDPLRASKYLLSTIAALVAECHY